MKIELSKASRLQLMARLRKQSLTIDNIPELNEAYKQTEYAHIFKTPLRLRITRDLKIEALRAFQSGFIETDAIVQLKYIFSVTFAQLLIKTGVKKTNGDSSAIENRDL